jgi:hypothetical protein
MRMFSIIVCLGFILFPSPAYEVRRMDGLSQAGLMFSWRISASVDVAGCPSTRLPRQAAPFAQTE